MHIDKFSQINCFSFPISVSGSCVCVYIISDFNTQRLYLLLYLLNLEWSSLYNMLPWAISCVCACVCTCECMWVQVHTHAMVLMDRGPPSSVGPCLSTFFETESLCHLVRHISCPRLSRDCPVSTSHLSRGGLRLQVSALLQPSLGVSSRNLNCLSNPDPLSHLSNLVF